MSLDTIQIFGTPIFHKKKVYDVNTKEFNFINNIQMNDEFTSTKISKDKFILNNNIMSNIKKVIDNYAMEFIKNIICLNNTFKMTNSWIAKSNKIHRKHLHKNAIFSVVYYVQAVNAGITFLRDTNFITSSYLFDLKFNKDNTYNATSYKLKVETGDIVIFPGNLSHEGNNQSDKEKITLGANYFIEGEVGNYFDVTSLTL